MQERRALPEDRCASLQQESWLNTAPTFYHK
jgi:hypothetical protein